MASISGVSETLLVISLIPLASSYHNIYPTIRRDGYTSPALYTRFVNRILRVILASVLVVSAHVHWEPGVRIVIENVILSCESLLEVCWPTVKRGR
jgi:succinate dehydrogenase hydrophobic anchor subunit